MAVGHRTAPCPKEDLFHMKNTFHLKPKHAVFLSEAWKSDLSRVIRGAMFIVILSIVVHTYIVYGSMVYGSSVVYYFYLFVAIYIYVHLATVLRPLYYFLKVRNQVVHTEFTDEQILVNWPNNSTDRVKYSSLKKLTCYGDWYCLSTGHQWFFLSAQSDDGATGPALEGFLKQKAPQIQIRRGKDFSIAVYAVLTVLTTIGLLYFNFIR